MSRIYPNSPCPCRSGRKYKNCCGKTSLNRNDLMDSFVECIQLMVASSYSYDRGINIESKRIAVEIRKMLHKTDKSKAIIYQLGKENLKFISSVKKDRKETDSYWIGLANYTIFLQQYTGKYNGGKCVPLYGDLRENENINDFEEWWNEIVFLDNFKKEYSRKDIILLQANQDNGAHVDPELPTEYYQTTRNIGVGLNIKINENEYNGSDVIWGITRQIAHELVFTFYRDESLKYKKCITDYIKDYQQMQ